MLSWLQSRCSQSISPKQAIFSSETSSKIVEDSISKCFSLERRENFQSFHGVSDDERNKMIISDTQEIFPPKQEGNSSYHQGKVDKPSSSSTPWIRLKDPRVVRIPRAFGGKDRHSKVCTIRGLRDRRVRLSVPTAIQLYDLQDRLGLSQPSKVVDWLLDAAKDEIDELPPLPFQPGNIGANYQSMLELASPGVFQSSGEHKISNNIENWEASSVLMRPSILSSDVLWRAKSEKAAREEENERENWRERVKRHRNGREKQVFSDIQCLPGMSYNVSNIFSHHMEASNLQSSLPGSQISTQAEDHLHNFNFMQLPPTFSLTTGSQIIICPPATQSYFPSPFEIDQRQVNHVQLMSSNSQNLFTNSLAPSLYPTIQSVRPFHFSMAPKLFASPDNNDDQPNKT